MMRTLVIGVSLIAAAVPAAAQDGTRIVIVARHDARDVAAAEQRRNDSRESQTDHFTRTLNIGTDGELDVSNIAGDIVVVRGSGNTATLDVTKTARAGSAEEAKAILPLVDVEISERGSRAEVRTRYPNQDEWRQRNRRNMNIDVAFKITAPANTRVIVKSISGNVTVSDIQGALTLESVSGNVKLSNAGRAAGAKSISGNVEVLDTKVEGALEAGSISGDVRIRRTSARSLTINSVSGNAIVEDVSCERVGAQTISGEVQFSGELQPNGRYELTSHSGSVRVALGGKTGFQLEATSFSGTITSDFPVTLQGGQAMGRGRNKGVRGSYGDGSAMLDLTTFSGSVVITKR